MAHNIAGTRLGVAYAPSRTLPAIRSFRATAFFIGNQSGRVMALGLNDGRKLWTADEAAYGPVWPVGGSVFLMSDRNRLVRLDAATGEFIWDQPLPLHTTDREKKRAEIYAHFGPLLAGGRLSWRPAMACSAASTRPTAHCLARSLPGGAASGPIAVGGTLYVVSRDGSLLAYR